ncbi:MAG: hypothetical protein HYY06_15675 [Deltaproteobacteria bacterium]|nr:hypothetical protein [Deltaproteobacteria bacterium]
MKTKTTLMLLALAMATGCAATSEESVASVEAALEEENGGFEMDENLDNTSIPNDELAALDDVMGTDEDIAALDVELVDDGDVAVEPIDDVPPDGICNHGGLIGRYVSLRPGMGVGRGRVYGADRNLVGHARFIWGTRRDGTHVIFGKYVDLDGRPIALFRGQADEGHFRGQWINSLGNVGVARGRYGDPDPTTRGGVFAGRWARTNCDEPSVCAEGADCADPTDNS